MAADEAPLHRGPWAWDTCSRRRPAPAAGLVDVHAALVSSVSPGLCCGRSLKEPESKPARDEVLEKILNYRLIFLLFLAFLEKRVLIICESLAYTFCDGFLARGGRASPGGVWCCGVHRASGCRAESHPQRREVLRGPQSARRGAEGVTSSHLSHVPQSQRLSRVPSLCSLRKLCGLGEAGVFICSVLQRRERAPERPRGPSEATPTATGCAGP